MAYALRHSGVTDSGQRLRQISERFGEFFRLVPSEKQGTKQINRSLRKRFVFLIGNTTWDLKKVKPASG
ncbi:MAG: hypothetical protein P8X79_13090 [Reinekea sp.]